MIRIEFFEVEYPKALSRPKRIEYWDNKQVFLVFLRSWLFKIRGFAFSPSRMMLVLKSNHSTITNQKVFVMVEKTQSEVSQILFIL